MIKVSVIVPVYKVPLEYLRACLDSLTAQTMQECEFILVSDGAPEAECSVCEEFAVKDSRFKFFKQEHAGVSTTRNYGLKQAQGEYITFADSDDWIDPTCCEELFYFAKQNDSEVVLFDYIPEGNQYQKLLYESTSKKRLSPTEAKEIRKQCIYLTSDKYVGAVSTVCKFVQRNLFLENNILFAKHIKHSEDRPVSYQIFKFSKKISYLKKSFYHYRAVNSSITHTIDNTPIFISLPYLTEIKKISSEYSNLIGNCALSSFICSLGGRYLNKNNQKNIFEKLHILRELVQSKEFQWLIQDATLCKDSNTPFIIKLDSFFILHKSSFPIWLHAAKWIIFRNS